MSKKSYILNFIIDANLIGRGVFDWEEWCLPGRSGV
jgi:hypothetical protein